MDDTPKKSLGQHWLHDASVLNGIVDAAQVVAGDTVVEIGPGLGTLTERLLARGANVTAIEFDQDLLNGLRAKFSTNERFTLVHEDVLQFDFSTLPAPYKIVANIPYYLTSHLLRILTDSATPPSQAALLVQKEVAERVCAKPGDMSILSVAVQLIYEASLSAVVPAAMFTPPPKVDSQVLVLKYRQQQLFENLELKKFMRVVKAGFSAKRKTLRNSLSGGLQLQKSEVEELLTKAGVSPDRRAETLNLEEWHRLVRVFS